MPLCPLSFKSWNNILLQSHLLYHEGAYVDVFGLYLSPTQHHLPKLDFLVEKLDSEDPHYYRHFLMNSVHFKCGSSLLDGTSWGCQKLFLGASDFAGHLVSTIGKVCWVRLSNHSPAVISAVKRLKKQDLDAAQKCSLISALPEALFLLYPALTQIDWTVEQPAARFLDRDSERGFTERKELSTITSVSTGRMHSTSASNASRKVDESALKLDSLEESLSIASSNISEHLDGTRESKSRNRPFDDGWIEMKVKDWLKLDEIKSRPRLPAGHDQDPVGSVDSVQNREDSPPNYLHNSPSIFSSTSSRESFDVEAHLHASCPRCHHYHDAKEVNVHINRRKSLQYDAECDKCGSRLFSWGSTRPQDTFPVYIDDGPGNSDAQSKLTNETAPSSKKRWNWARRLHLRRH